MGSVVPSLLPSPSLPRGALKSPGETQAHVVGQQSPDKVQTWVLGPFREEGPGRSTGGGEGWRGLWKEEARDCLGADQGPEEGALCEGQAEPGSECRVRGRPAANLEAAPTLGRSRP